MEEWVGKIWHRFITRAAGRGHPRAAVRLDEMRTTLGVLFRAFGGDGGLKIEAAHPTTHGAPRRLLARIAGTGRTLELAWRDAQVLHLPDCIDCFDAPELNRDLYLWLAALAAHDRPQPGEAWLARNGRTSAEVLARLPGLAVRYQRLVEAHLAQRPDPAALPSDEAAQEIAIRAALRSPHGAACPIGARRPPQPVPLWLHPASLVSAAGARTDGDDGAPPAGESREGQARRPLRAERVDMPKGEGGLLAMRFEALLTLGEYLKLDRGAEEEEDAKADRAAEDLEVLSVARDARPVAQRFRFDLDLPAPAWDDLPVGEGIPLPEWDYRAGRLRPQWCRLQPMVAREAGPVALPPHLVQTARRLRGQFQALASQRQLRRGEQDGSDIDLDACVRACAERGSAPHPSRGLYQAYQAKSRDLSCLVLADLSLSTDAAVNDEARVIDVIQDSLLLLAEALAAAGDRFALYGFSSRKRAQVRFHLLKGFEERYGDTVRGRIAAVKPGYYTRMGAALRHSTALLGSEPAGRRLLLLLTDGKPNDLDQYEGRYGLEDTRVALREARRAGIYPFCVTIDRAAGDYLPHLFGPGHFVVITRPEELPQRLPLLYARLTA